MGAKNVPNANPVFEGMTQDAKDAMRALQGCSDVMWMISNVSPEV